MNSIDGIDSKSCEAILTKRCSMHYRFRRNSYHSPKENQENPETKETASETLVEQLEISVLLLCFQNLQNMSILVPKTSEQPGLLHPILLGVRHFTVVPIDHLGPFPTSTKGTEINTFFL